MYSGNNIITDQEAERQALSIAMQDNKAAFLVKSLPLDMFTDPLCRMVHGAMQELEPDEIDVTTVNGVVSMKGKDISEHLVGLQLLAPLPSMIGSYIRILSDRHTRRRLVAEAEELKAHALDPQIDTEEARGEAITKLRSMGEFGEKLYIDSRDAMDNCIRNMDKLLSGDKSDIFKTGIFNLDNWFSGIFGSRLIVIGARPGTGKSALALQIAHLAAMKGKRVLICGFEMSAEETTNRIASRRMMVPTERIEEARLTENELKVYKTMIAPDIRELPIYHMLRGNTVEAVRQTAQQLIDNGGLSMIICDHMQLMSAVNLKETKNNQTAEISKALKNLTMEYGIPIISISQLNRENEKANRKPTLSDLRDSGAIEQDANVVMLIYAPDEKNTEADMRETRKKLLEQGKVLCVITVSKNRGGKPGSAYSAFDGNTMQFTGIENDKKRESYSHYTG